MSFYTRISFYTQTYECRGICGEPCPFMCPDCNQRTNEENAVRYLGASVSQDTRWLFLRDCLHTLPVSACLYVSCHDSVPIMLGG